MCVGWEGVKQNSVSSGTGRFSFLWWQFSAQRPRFQLILILWQWLQLLRSISHNHTQTCPLPPTPEWHQEPSGGVSQTTQGVFTDFRAEVISSYLKPFPNMSSLPTYKVLSLCAMRAGRSLWCSLQWKPILRKTHSTSRSGEQLWESLTEDWGHTARRAHCCFWDKEKALPSCGVRRLCPIQIQLGNSSPY